MTPHRVVVTYTTDDDGIHLWCEGCPWSSHVGWSPTPEQLVAEELEHLRTAL